MTSFVELFLGDHLLVHLFHEEELTLRVQKHPRLHEIAKIGPPILSVHLGSATMVLLHPKP